MTHYVFVTGGVFSSLGKGILTASLAAVLEAGRVRVNIVKMDPYINVDPGTMSPFQHGEVVRHRRRRGDGHGSRPSPPIIVMWRT